MKAGSRETGGMTDWQRHTYHAQARAGRVGMDPGRFWLECYADRCQRSRECYTTGPWHWSLMQHAVWWLRTHGSAVRHDLDKSGWTFDQIEQALSEIVGPEYAGAKAEIERIHKEARAASKAKAKAEKQGAAR